MEFTVLERLLLLQLLNKLEGNLVLLRQARALQDVVGFTAAETEALEFAQQGKQVVWRDGRVPPVPITIPPSIHQALVALLRGLSEAGTLSASHLSLCDKLLPEEAPDAGGQ